MEIMEGIEATTEVIENCEVESVFVKTDAAAAKIGRTTGTYYTIYPGNHLGDTPAILPAGDCVATILHRTLSPYYGHKLCIVGVGNPGSSWDSVGPKTVEKLYLQLFQRVPKDCRNFSDIFSILPNVLATTNLSTSTLVENVASAQHADCILLIDALCASDYVRFCRTIGVSSSGGLRPSISLPGADWSKLQIPTISLGVPVAVRAEAGVGEGDELLVSAEIDQVVDKATTILAYAILRILYPTLSPEEIYDTFFSQFQLRAE